MKTLLSSPDLEPLDQLLSEPCFSWRPETKKRVLLSALNKAFQHHFQNCASYRHFCRRRGVNAETRFDSYEQLPFLPVQAFKENAELLCSVAPADIKTRLQSSATSGIASTVTIDKVTSRRQIKALAAVLSEVLGATRRPFLVVDLDPRSGAADVLGARNAAVRGFLNMAREVQYFMMREQDGRLSLRADAFSEALERHSQNEDPVVVFGFTFVLYVSGVLPLLKLGRSFRLPPGSFVIHIGGWKKLVDQQVSKGTFTEAMVQAFGVPASSVVDFYGFTEQIGVTYPDGPDGQKCTPAFAEVLVRDPISMEILQDGREGLLEFLTPIPFSYPGIAVLTDDIGVITERDSERSGGWQGTRFRVLGRAATAEVRGCGDIMAEKIAPSLLSRVEVDQDQNGFITIRPRLLFDGLRNYCPADLRTPLDLQELPEVEDLTELCDRLRKARQLLDQYSIDELVALISAAARRWIALDSSLAVFRQQGLLFLCNWCQPSALRRMADRSLRDARGIMDTYLPIGGLNRRLIRAFPRGLVVHWLAGNVPLLGMLGIVQAILTRNANLVKAASSFSSVLPALLESFRGLELETRSGRTLRGDDVLAATAVVYFMRDDLRAAAQVSRAADVRLAWGGREAIESILHLPRQLGTEDIIFGPKISYMVVGREALSTAREVRRIARGAATDASVFDQYACASPHTIFVERGGAAASAREFARCLADEMAKALIRIPKAPVDPGTSANVQRRRMDYEFTGELWHSIGTEWTVLFDEDAHEGLAEPSYSRVITVRSVEDIMEAASFAHRGIQTIGIALAGPRKIRFAEQAARLGVDRFPDIGRMTLFDTPWDGLFPMDRMVRWVTVGGPL
ncbi:MAG: acyl-CoA reductase [Verrucomicrobia bacterium]|nr:acyl-CoA reductase [Verrucomicrobiota bacterium]